MTKRTLVFLPCLAIALMALGCSVGGESGALDQASSSFASVYSDPYEEGLALGYVSTLAADFPGDPESYVAQQAEVSQDTGSASRQLFETPQLSMKVAQGQVGLSTLAPIGMQRQDVDTEMPRARDLGNGLISVTSGTQTANLVTFTDPDGATRTASMGSNGTVTLNGEETFPKLLEVPGVGRAVILASGTVLPVE